jgi:WD40 repeat protein
MWDLTKDRPIRTFASTSGGVQSVAVMPDGVRGVTGAYDGTIYLWNLNTGQLLEKFDELASSGSHGNWVTSLITMPDNVHILSAHHEYQACVWNVNKKRIVHKFGMIADALALSRDGRTIAASNRNDIYLWPSPV